MRSQQDQEMDWYANLFWGCVAGFLLHSFWAGVIVFIIFQKIDEKADDK